MRMRRFVRLAVLALPVLGLLGSSVQPASAREVASVAFQGNAVLTGGLGYPGVTGDPTPCVTGATTKPSPKGHATVNLGVCGNLRNFNLVALAVGGYAAVGKPKAPVGAGVGAVFAQGTVSGFCGLSTGAGTGTITAPNTYTVTFKFTGLGGTLVVTGTVVKPSGHRGNFEAVVEAVPIVTPTGTTLGNSCSNKGAFNFTIAGAAHVKVNLV